MNAYVLSAAVGLLGILAGEQLPGLVRQWMHRGDATPTHVSWLEQKVRPHMFGRMPGCNEAGTGPATAPATSAPDTVTKTTTTATTVAAAHAETKDV